MEHDNNDTKNFTDTSDSAVDTFTELSDTDPNVTNTAVDTFTETSDTDTDTENPRLTEYGNTSDSNFYPDTTSNSDHLSDSDALVSNFTDASVQHNSSELALEGNELNENEALTGAQQIQNSTPIHTLCETTDSGSKQRVGDVYADEYGSSANVPHGEQEQFSILDSSIAWEAAVADENQWLAIDIGSVRPVWGVVTQAPKSRLILPKAGNQRVTAYTVDVNSLSFQGPWTAVEDGKKFPGNLQDQSEDKVTNKFREPVAARFVRVNIEEWNNHIAMRVGLLLGDGL